MAAQEIDHKNFSLEGSDVEAAAMALEAGELSNFLNALAARRRPNIENGGSEKLSHGEGHNQA